MTTPLSERSTRAVAMLYLLSALVFILLDGLAASRLGPMAGPGRSGMFFLAWASPLSMGLAFRARAPHQGFTLLLAAVTAVLFPPVVSAALLSDGSVSSSFGLLLVSLGIVSAAASVQERFLTSGAFVVGALWALISLVLGVLSLAFPDRVAGLEMDSSGRYGDWMRAVGLSPFADSFGALTGVAPSRQALGATLAILIVIQIHLVRSVSTRLGIPRIILLLPGVGCTLGLTWSLSRTGVLAVFVGLLISAVPWGRLKARFAVAVLTAAVVLLLMAPLATALIVQRQEASQDTFAWRTVLWRTYLRDSAVWTPFGLGPNAEPPIGAGHAHNQLLEFLAAGGLFALLGLVLFLTVVSYLVVTANPPAVRVGAGALGTFAAVGMFELPVSPRDDVLSMAWLLLLIALSFAAVSRVGDLRPRRSNSIHSSGTSKSVQGLAKGRD